MENKDLKMSRYGTIKVNQRVYFWVPVSQITQNKTKQQKENKKLNKRLKNFKISHVFTDFKKIFFPVKTTTPQ